MVTLERVTQNKVINFFKNELKYNYLGNLEDEVNYNLRKDDVIAFLTSKMGYSSVLASKAFDELEKTTKNLQQGLYHANKEIYPCLKLSPPRRFFSSEQRSCPSPLRAVLATSWAPCPPLCAPSTARTPTSA